MALDPNIALQVQAPQIQNPLTTYAQVAGIQNAQQQNALTGLAIQQAQRQQEQTDAVNNAFKAPGAVNADGTLNAPSILGNVASSGFGAAIPGIAKQLTEAQTARLQQQKSALELGSQHASAIGQVLAGVNDQASYDRALQYGRGTYGDSVVASLPSQYDPAVVNQLRAQTQTLQQQLEQQNKQIDQQLQALQLGETQRHNLAGEATAQGQLGVAQQNAKTQQGQLAVAQQNAARQAQTAQQANQQQQSLLQGGLATYDQALHTLDNLQKSPGLSGAVGLSSMFPTRPGSDTANFEAQLDTFRAQNFLPMVANLKGMGALSDAEGKKLTDAVGALSTKQSEQAFRASLDEIKNTLLQSRERLAGQLNTIAPGVSTAPANPVNSSTPVGTVRSANNGKSYRFDGHGWLEVQ
ncbi:hypothetical protein [Burkholderia gladioli]|uniref:hypothetical protein n=1 Tax=Burkholderia gladioli TaxID=28095 RepID=UPI001640AB9C|nr:hypothetical protein [Burkholderia gladioli]